MGKVTVKDKGEEKELDISVDYEALVLAIQNLTQEIKRLVNK